MTLTVKPPVQLDSNTTPDYVKHLTACQNQLYAYIFTLLNNAETAWDVLQETNAVLWSKAGEFDDSRPFVAWAMGIAFQQVRAARTRFGRDRLVFQDKQTLESLSEDLIAAATQHAANSREIAMESCLEKLTAEQQSIVEQFYKLDYPLKTIAAKLGRSANSIGVILHRVRLSLGKCIEQAINQPPAAPNGVEGQS